MEHPNIKPHACRLRDRMLKHAQNICIFQGSAAASTVKPDVSGDAQGQFLTFGTFCGTIPMTVRLSFVIVVTNTGYRPVTRVTTRMVNGAVLRASWSGRSNEIEGELNEQ